MRPFPGALCPPSVSGRHFALSSAPFDASLGEMSAERSRREALISLTALAGLGYAGSAKAENGAILKNLSSYRSDGGAEASRIARLRSARDQVRTV